LGTGAQDGEENEKILCQRIQGSACVHFKKYQLSYSFLFRRLFFQTITLFRLMISGLGRMQMWQGLDVSINQITSVKNETLSSLVLGRTYDFFELNGKKAIVSN
jgi:hypothetical protein